MSMGVLLDTHSAFSVYITSFCNCIAIGFGPSGLALGAMLSVDVAVPMHVQVTDGEVYSSFPILRLLSNRSQDQRT